MAPFAFLALVLAAIDPNMPIGRTAPPPPPPPGSGPPVAPAPAAPAVDSAAVRAPSDDYGYVAFCYGAESAYVDLYDQVMPEVERIERTFPGSVPIDKALAEYPQLRSDSQAHLTAYAAALTAAEKSSIQAIPSRGQQSIRQGRATWDGAATATPAEIARAWMGWSAPSDCVTRATALSDRWRVLSSALPPLTTPGSVELDRLAKEAALAAAVRSPLATAPATSSAAPPVLTLRGPASVPAVAAPSPATSSALGVSLAAPAPTAIGLGVSFDGSTASAPVVAPSPSSQAVPAGLPPLLTPPSSTSASEPLPWRGVL